jgi:electron transfer flavoprotein alpha subunit
MAQGILVFIEHRDGTPLKVSLEALGEARRVADKMSEPVAGVILGSDASAVAAKIPAGADRILTGESPLLDRYSSSAYARAIATAVESAQPRAVFIGGNIRGRDLAPRLAARLAAGLVSDCIELRVEGAEIHAVRPVYAGKARWIVRAASEPFIVTTRPNVFDPPAADAAGSGTVESFDPGIAEGDVLAPVASFEKKESDRPELTEASIIVSGGRGMKGPENFHLVESLAKELEAAVGASRAVVDAGWREHGDQVGQTGKTVSPNLYVACGISGAIQHLAGMSSSKVIVAINKDKDAPIFKVADYGIVGDVFEVLPALTEEIHKMKQG